MFRQSSETRYARAMAQLRSKTSPIEKYIYLHQLKQHDVNMFYRIVVDNLTEGASCMSLRSMT